MDDSEDDILLAQMALRRTGIPHRLEVARDGEAALAWLTCDRAATEIPAVVLLDLKLPRRDGREVLRALRGHPCTARVPVVVLSSSRLEQDVLDAYTLGANSYISKPIDFGVFQSTVSVLMPCWLRLNVASPFQPRVGPRSELDEALAAPIFVPPVLPEAPAPLRRSTDVLVIDGSDADRAATTAALATTLGRDRILALSSFRESAEFFKRFGGPPPLLSDAAPRLVFVDANLPDGDGRDLLQALRYRGNHHILIVVFARDPTPAFVGECYRLKVNSVVAKPEDPAAYHDAIRLLAHYWIHVNEPPPAPKSGTQPRARPG
ncbi:MAG: response regulator [Myxococcota bacterium]